MTHYKTLTATVPENFNFGDKDCTFWAIDLAISSGLCREGDTVETVVLLRDVTLDPDSYSLRLNAGGGHSESKFSR